MLITQDTKNRARNLELGGGLESGDGGDCVIGVQELEEQLLLQLLNPYHTISAITALQAAAQLEVACPIFCVLRDEHLSIDRPVCPFFASPASSCCCWLRLAATP